MSPVSSSRKSKTDETVEKDELKRIKEQHRREIVALKHSANKALVDALNDQQRQITQKYYLQLFQCTPGALLYCHIIMRNTSQNPDAIGITT